MNVVITGSTGMVGKSVLFACLADSRVEKVLLINRSPIDVQHDKISELLIGSFTELTNHKQQLTGYDACYHCMGVSAVGMSEEQYSKVTYSYTKILADTFYNANPNAVFTYVSGVGTDSSESGSSMWGRVKGKTENYILNKGFKDAYAFRPGGILPPKGVKSRTGWYNTLYLLMRPFFPLMKKMKSIVTGTAIGEAMLALTLSPVDQKVIDPIMINTLARANK
jgi:nucleoside-diphosphate-sugar epimerase